MKPRKIMPVLEALIASYGEDVEVFIATDDCNDEFWAIANEMYPPAAVPERRTAANRNDCSNRAGGATTQEHGPHAPKGRGPGIYW